MARQLAVVTIPSDAVQGEGSWVKVRAITHGQAKELQRLAQAGDLAAIQAASDPLLMAHIVDWNWADETGVPLPLPKNDPTVLDRLLEVETDFLGNAIGSTVTASKK